MKAALSHYPFSDPNPLWARPAIALLQKGMTQDLLKPEWRGGPTPTAGHCYAGSEALFHALGRQDAGWKSVSMRFGPGTHWFLLHRSGVILDPTWDQFGVLAPYAQGKGAGFLTLAPSKRARALMDKAGWSENCLREMATASLHQNAVSALPAASTATGPSRLCTALAAGPSASGETPRSAARRRTLR